LSATTTIWPTALILFLLIYPLGGMPMIFAVLKNITPRGQIRRERLSPFKD
jgi:small neutral amino acid transporter SnatA (MarC family)